MLHISAGEHELQIDPVNGGRAVSWRIGGVEVLANDEGHPITGGWYVMAPWVGRIRNAAVNYQGRTFIQPLNFDQWAIHGSMPFSECRVLAHSSDEVVISHTTSRAWPIAAVVTSVWEVNEWGISTRASIATTAGEFPASLGWHPWFRRNLDVGQSARYELEINQKFARDADNIVTGELSDAGSGPFDDSFTVPNGHAYIEWPGFRRIDIDSDVRFMHLYEAESSVCIEPETAPPNGVNLLDLGFGHVVRPQQPLTAEAHWRVSLV